MRRKLVFALCSLAQHIDHVAYAQAPWSTKTRERAARRFNEALLSPAQIRDIMKKVDERLEEKQ